MSCTVAPSPSATCFGGLFSAGRGAGRNRTSHDICGTPASDTCSTRPGSPDDSKDYSPKRWRSSACWAGRADDCADSRGVADATAVLSAALKRVDAIGGEAPSAKHEAKLTITHLLTADTPAWLLTRIDTLDFEARKDLMRLFGAVLKLGVELKLEAKVIEYVRSHPQIAQLLFEGCGRPEVFSHCAQMLRSCTQYPELVQFLLERHAVTKLIELVQRQGDPDGPQDSFDIASEAFSTLREILLAHRSVSANHVQANFDEFFELYHRLLRVDDYVTQRQALHLLGEMLLDRAFMKVMVVYVGNHKFLQIHMILLGDSSQAIQVEAFHILKIFVANPRKPLKVLQILERNGDKLARLISKLKDRKGNDSSLSQDIQTVLKSLQDSA